MRRTVLIILALAVAAAMPGFAVAHELFDHPAEPFTVSGPASTGFNAGGEGAEWELLTSFPTGNPHTDLDFFTQGGETYVSVGTLASGPNAGGQSILRLTEDGEAVDESGAPNASFVAGHPSASCISNPSAALGLQHDIEATPKGTTLLNTQNPWADRSDTQLLIDATDAEGRCHDQGAFGAQGAPQGGLEIIDVTDPENPVEIGLTSHIGEAHTVNVDPKRPHIAYSVSSDSVSIVDEEETGNPDDYSRVNEAEDGGLGLDGFEVVDLSSCMNFPEGTSVEDKRAQCRPEVYRYRYPDLKMVLGHTNHSSVYACHELEVYPDDKLMCASGAALLALDMSGAFDDNGTPDDYTDDTPRGEPLPCRERESTSEAGFGTGATIIDCVVGQDEADLSVHGWLESGAPSLEGVEWIGSAYHMGRESTTSGVDPAYPSTEDIDFNHEAELTHSGDFAFASDERGGGVLPPGATCSMGPDNTAGNGGVHAYRMDALKTEFPAVHDDEGNYDAAATAEEAFESYARTPDGEKAIIRVPIRTPKPQGALCTAHVFQQIPDQQRIFMGWYSQGTHILDYVEHPDGTFEWEEVAYFIPENANQWVSHVFDYEQNEDGTWTYYGVAGDFNLGESGRSAIDIYRVTMPPPAQPLARDQSPDGACDANYVPDDAFGDAEGSVHADAIDCIAWYGVTVGKGDTDGDGDPEYAPDGAVRRDEMASFIARLAVEGGIDLPTDAADYFEDDDNSVHEDNINALAALGLVDGVGDGDGDGRNEFAPAGEVSRAQMASFIARTHERVTGSLPTSPPNAFDDDDGSTHHDAINALADLGVVEGRQDTEDADGDGDTDERLYFPQEDVSRAQMASFIGRDLGLFVDAGEAIAGGADVKLDAAETAPGGDLAGSVTSRKQVTGLVADGCGIHDREVTPDAGGSFTVSVPEGQPAGDCLFRVTATTARGGEATAQAVRHSFAVTVSGS